MFSKVNIMEDVDLNEELSEISLFYSFVNESCRRIVGVVDNFVVVVG